MTYASHPAQADRFKPLLKAQPLKSSLKTLPNPDGLQVDTPFDDHILIMVKLPNDGQIMITLVL